jgi:hypothetical protein
MTEGEVIAEWNVIDFPDSKADIERYVSERFVDVASKAGLTIYNYQQNKESDFDFTLNFPGEAVPRFRCQSIKDTLSDATPCPAIEAIISRRIWPIAVW